MKKMNPYAVMICCNYSIVKAVKTLNIQTHLHNTETIHENHFKRIGIILMVYDSDSPSVDG